MRSVPASLLVIAALLLAGCGYRPLYGSSSDNAGVAATLSSVSIPEADSRLGQIIRNDLISSMRSGSGGDRYTLLINAKVKESNIIDKPSPAAARQAMQLNVTYDLVERATGKTVHSGKTFSQASYDITNQPFADQQAQTNATERVAHEASADIRTRLAAYFAAHPPSP